MRRLKIIFLFIIIITTVSISFADINNKAGNNSAQFLKAVPGGRAPALGNAVTSLGDTVESLFFNPSGIGFLDHMEIHGCYSKWYEGLNYSAAAVEIPLKNIGTMGAGFIGLFYGNIPLVLLDEDGELSSTDSTTAQDTAFFLSFARTFAGIGSLGLNVKLIGQTLEEESSTAFAFDAGWMIKLSENRLGIGIVLQNIGTKVEFMDSAYNLPLMARFGVSYVLLNSQDHSGLITVDALKATDDNFKGAAGLEYAFNHTIYIRGGYQIAHDLADFSIGGGIKFSPGNNLLKVDYAYLPYGDLGLIHSLGVTWCFQ